MWTKIFDARFDGLDDFFIPIAAINAIGPIPKHQPPFDNIRFLSKIGGKQPIIYPKNFFARAGIKGWLIWQKGILNHGQMLE